ncbi:MAG: hypothetical protein Q8N57_03095 [bacterium]|nr:hypothetical protein [bacterium]
MKIQEEIKKVLQKFVEFFGGIKQAVCLLIALLLIWYLAHLSIVYTLPVIVLFWALSEFADIPKARKTLALTLKLIVLVVFLSSLAVKYLPRVKEKKATLIALVDQKVSGAMGQKVNVLAKDSWEREKERKSKEFLVYYKSLLAKGKTKEAADTLAGFKRHWDIKLQSQVIPPPAISVPVAPPQPPSQQQDKNLLTKYGVGNHLLSLNADGETGWLQIPCNQAYDFEKNNCTFTVYYADGTVVNSWDGVKWPAKPVFRVKNRSDAPIVLKVI